MDTRVKLTVPVAGYVNYNARIDFQEDIGDKEQCPTDMGLYADYSHLTALMAPRPTLLIYNSKDFFNPSRTKPGLYDPVLPFYGLYGRAKDFAFHVNTDPGNHNYGLDNRQAFYRFLNDHFPPAGKRMDVEINSEQEVLGEAALQVDLPKNNPVGAQTWVALGTNALAELPRLQALLPTAGAGEQWSTALRRRLQQVLRFQPLSATVVKAVPFCQPPLAGHAVQYRIGGEWLLPAVELIPAQPRGTTLLVADGGKAQTAALVTQLLAAGQKVVAVDTLFTGEMASRFPVQQSAMLIEALGARPLGIKVSQIFALRNALAEQSPNIPITLMGVGGESAVAVLLTAGLVNKGDQVVTVGLLGSLKELITGGGSYNRTPSLFCYGLLELADSEQFILLAGGLRNVRQLKKMEAFP